MARHLRRAGHEVGRRRARRLMAKMGLTPLYQRPRTSDPHPQHRVYPDLLRKLVIDRPNHVWCADVTYMPMRRGSPIRQMWDVQSMKKSIFVKLISQIMHPWGMAYARKNSPYV